MPYVVRLHVFSGRPDPTWILSEGDAVELRDRVASTDRITNRRPSGILPRLGYRGFTVTEVSDRPSERLYIHEGVVERALAPSIATDSPELETWLLETAGGLLDSVVEAAVRGAMQQPPFDIAPFNMRKGVPCPKCVAVDAPTYFPGKWNIPTVEPFNNCYNYANDQITNTFAQPGNATGNPIASLTCTGVQPSAVSDGLAASSNFLTVRPAGKGWYVALVIWPGVDYHWYRQDNAGCWSHKPGGTAATNLDNSGKTIADPNTCDRGGYTDFCSYMVTNRGVTIQ